MILMHRGQRGAGVRDTRLFGVMRRAVETAGMNALLRLQNIAHRSDLAPLCISSVRSPAPGREQRLVGDDT